mmetsp:Transcript_31381/g.53166  ORF Transcript_31381/g.53166 Transcript_31381/m.53166 type:complete len:225 (-) Transcript_31381:315-989(-)
MVVNKGSCFWQINFAEEEKVSKTSPLFALPLPFFSLVGLADTEGLGVGGLVGGDGRPLLFPAFPATDGFKLGSDEGWLDIEGTLLGFDDGALETEGFNEGVEDGSPDADGFKLGSDEGVEDGSPDTDGFELGCDLFEGWFDMEGTLLGSDDGALETDGFNEGLDDGSPDTDGFKLGSDEGFEVGDGVLVPSEMEITAVPGAVEISIELTVIVTVFPVPPKFEIA